MKKVILFLGIGADSVDPENLTRLELKVRKAHRLSSADQVQIIDWEKWRDGQPLRQISQVVAPLVTRGLGAGLLGFLADYVSDYITDIPAVRKYIRSAELGDLMLENQRTTSDITVLGHSLGSLPALVLGYHLQKMRQQGDTSVVLYSPPIGYKFFHRLFKPLLDVNNTTIYLGTRDWLSKLIWFKDRHGVNPSNLSVLQVDATHDLLDYLQRDLVSTPVELGRLFNKIRKS